MSRMLMGTSQVAEPFWKGTEEKVLRLQFCKDCGKAHHYPRNFCPHCHGENLEWKDASGEGTIYAITVCHKPGLPTMAASVPYAVALVDLAEGPRMMTNVTGLEDINTAKVGDKVKVAWEDAGGGKNLPVFQIA